MKKQKRYLISAILLMLLICITTFYAIEYNKNNNKSSENLVTEYSITTIDSTYIHKELEWENNVGYKIIKVEHMSDYSLEQKINASIDYAMTSWISEYILYADTANLQIYSHSTNYLSFLNYLKFQDKDTYYVHDYITIDLKTGERVMLDDLVEINEEFVEYIQNNNCNTKTINDARYSPHPDTLKEYTTEELLQELKECSVSRQEAIDNQDSAKKNIHKPLSMRRNSFYLRDNQLVIVIAYPTGLRESHYAFNLDDISEFLKVEKW